eukprot:102647_1
MRTSNSTHRVNPNVESKSRTVQLLPDLPPEQSTYKTFKFTASDNDWKHGSKWANGIMPIIAGAMICVMKPAIGVLFIVIGIIILVSFCTLQNMSCPTTYNISFDEEHYMVHLYSGSHLTHSFSYNNFAQLWFETREETYCIFVCLGCWIRAGTGTYCGGVVYAVMKNSKQYRINNSLCYGAHEFAHTKRMVARANRYYKVDRHNIRIQTCETIVVLQKEGETQKEETDGRVAKTDIDASSSLHIIFEKDDIINNNSIIMQTEEYVNININK